MAAVAGVGDDCYVFARISMFSPSIFPVVVVAGFVDDSSEFAKQIRSSLLAPDFGKQEIPFH